jgi:hypothetical protein
VPAALRPQSRPRPLTRSLPRTEALWHSVPIVPRHDPPKAVGGDFPSLVHELAAFLFSPAGLLALVDRHSERVTMATFETEDAESRGGCDAHPIPRLIRDYVGGLAVAQVSDDAGRAVARLFPARHPASAIPVAADAATGGV